MAVGAATPLPSTTRLQGGPWRRARGPARAATATAALCGLFAWAQQAPGLFALPAATAKSRGCPLGQGGLAGCAVARRSAGSAVLRRAEDSDSVRVGLLFVPGQDKDVREAFEKRNVTNETYFQTEVPNGFQMPLAAKLLAMSNTVDVVVAAHGELKEDRPAVLRGYQTVALTTNVPIVPLDSADGLAAAVDAAIVMGEIRRQALLGGGVSGQKSIFFGLGKNATAAPPKKKEKIYF